jgi:intracellular multiplication protein IcmL
MTTERSSPRDNALVKVFLRQIFYLQQLRLVLGAVLLNILLIVSLLAMLWYFIKHPVHPLYFATDKVGRLLVDPPLSQPNMSLDEVTNWVVNAVQVTYSYDFVNYRKQLQGSQKYFTDYGWRQYMKGLEVSNNLLALTEHKMIVSAKVVAKPKLLIQGILGSRYAWKFEMPVLVTYLEPPYEDKNKFSNPLIVSVTVERQKLLESDHGLGIVQLIANLAIGVNPENMTSPGG